MGNEPLQLGIDYSQNSEYMKHWWKILGAMLLLYVLTIGLLAPLAPGITLTDTTDARTGQRVEMVVTGYNSSFATAQTVRAWLELDSAHAVCASEVKALNEQQLQLAFQLPNDLPGEKNIVPATLILNNEVDGSSVLPDAVFLKRDSLVDSTNVASWTACAVAGLYPNERYDFPFRNILAETIRNLYFHVPMWFGMIFIFTASMIFSVRHLRGGQALDDIRARTFATVGILYGLMGIVTGGIWAQYTWGSFWSFDVKQNMSAIALLIYMAYFVLRGSFEDYDKSARIGAVFNIFAFAAMIPLLFIIPRMTASLHPGNGGNPGFGGEDLDNTMRTVFYPAVIGWTLLGFWISQLLYRFEKVKQHLLDRF